MAKSGGCQVKSETEKTGESIPDHAIIALTGGGDDGVSALGAKVVRGLNA
jgi:hypothetical protein